MKAELKVISFFLTHSYYRLCILKTALVVGVAGGWGGWYILSPAGFTQSKKLVSTEGNLRTHVLNLQMIKLSPREEAGFAEVIAGIMQAAIPVSRILGYCCFPCLLCHISCLKAFDSTLNGGSSMLTPHIIS